MLLQGWTGRVSRGSLARSFSCVLCTDTIGKRTNAECLRVCRVPDHRHSAKTSFAECQDQGTWQTLSTRHALPEPSTGRRQKNGTRHTAPLPSAKRRALGKDRSRAQHARRLLSFAECCKDGTRQSVNFAECLCSALGKASFAGCHPHSTRQIVSIFIFLSFKIFYNQLKFENLIPGGI